jgi:hypothetical protein
MNKKNSKKIVFIILIALLLVALIISAYFRFPEIVSKFSKRTQEISKEVIEDIQQNIQDIYNPKTVLASKFAQYKETPVNFNPQVPFYRVKSDLSNIENIDDFSFSETEKKLLAQNAFAVRLAPYNNEFFSIYEANRYGYTPNFITADSILQDRKSVV